MTLDAALEQRLLGRPGDPVLSAADRRALKGQRFLVTGAGGSLGAELARQLAAVQPAQLMLLDHAEYPLFRIEREIREAFPGVPLEARLGDVSRRADVRAACLAARPSAVYHAAACKHVAIAERALVPAARVNVLGTAETAAAAREAGARFVLVSSDTAAEPRSVMGATKRLAEVHALGQRTRGFRPIAVRCGNILGSSGSVVEIMAAAIAAGRDVPVTAPDASRVFLTAREAASLVLKADLVGRGGEVFCLEMGQPLRIGELAERVIAALTPEGRPRVGIAVIGLRPGETLRVELATQGLAMRPTSHPRIVSARQPEIAGPVVASALRRIRLGCARGDAGAVLGALEAAVDDYVPSPAAREAAHAPVAMPSRRAVATPAHTRLLGETAPRAAGRR